MAAPTLIYCADGNSRYIEIAENKADKNDKRKYGSHHFKLGAQMPRKVYTDDLYFIDVHPKKLPPQPVYVSKLRKYRPVMASVHDWDEMRRFEEIMMRAEEIAQYTDNVVIIPKVLGGIQRLSRALGKTKTVGGKRVILGYSVATDHGSTPVDKKEFKDWPVHLLGGSPHKQMRLFKEFSEFAEVVSLDGNMHNKMANRHCAFWDPLKQTPRGYWSTLEKFDGERWGDGGDSADAPYEAFRRSCHNIYALWNQGEFIKRSPNSTKGREHESL